MANSLERGFQGENLSVDEWGLLGDWGLRQYLQFKQIGEQDGFVARAAVAAETERPAENVVLCTTSFADLRSPQTLHSYTVWATSAPRRRSSARN